MRLIDADEIIDSLGGSDMDFAIGAVIDEQPTAFDVDKVVGELKRDKFIESECILSDVHQGYNAGLSLRYAGKIIDVYDNFLVISFTGDTDNTAVVRVSCTDGIHINAACNHTTAIMICMVSDDLCSSRCCKKLCYIMMVNFCEMISYSLKTCC